MYKIFNKMNVSEFCAYLLDNKYAKFAEGVFYHSVNNPEGTYEYQAKIENFAESELVIMNFIGGGAPFIYDLTESEESFEDAIRRYLNENHFIDETVYVEL